MTLCSLLLTVKSQVSSYCVRSARVSIDIGRPRIARRSGQSVLSVIEYLERYSEKRVLADPSDVGSRRKR